jgi:hypothetical protein
MPIFERFINIDPAAWLSLLVSHDAILAQLSLSVSSFLLHRFSPGGSNPL